MDGSPWKGRKTGSPYVPGPEPERHRVGCTRTPDARWTYYDPPILSLSDPSVQSERQNRGENPPGKENVEGYRRIGPPVTRRKYPTVLRDTLCSGCVHPIGPETPRVLRPGVLVGLCVETGSDVDSGREGSGGPLNSQRKVLDLTTLTFPCP